MHRYNYLSPHLFVTEMKRRRKRLLGFDRGHVDLHEVGGEKMCEIHMKEDFQ